MKNLHKYIAIIILFANISTASATCVEKACFQNQMTLDNSKLELIGTYKFTYLFFDVYTIALYGPKGFHTSKQILSNVPKKIIFHYHRAIKKEQMIDGAKVNLEDNPKVNISIFTKELKMINEKYVNVEKGDRYALSYTPEKGLTLSLNDKLLVRIPGADFAQAYFGIWLSNYPLSESLRDGLLKGN